MASKCCILENGRQGEYMRSNRLTRTFWEMMSLTDRRLPEYGIAVNDRAAI
jgi:hypothetical protein